MTQKQRKEIKGIFESIKDLVCLYVLDDNINTMTENDVKEWTDSLYNEVAALQNMDLEEEEEK